MLTAAQLIAYATGQKYSAFCDVASLALLCFDYCLTFDDEVRYVWRSPWNFAKALFFLTRYLPFTDMSVMLFHRLSPIITPGECRWAYTWTAASFLIGIAIADGVLAMRTWAIWGGTRTGAGLLWSLYIVVWIPSAVVLAYFCQSLDFELRPDSGLFGCFIAKSSTILSIVWALIMAFEIVIFLATVLQGFRQRFGGTEMMAALYWDALIFSTVLTSISIANLVIVQAAPSAYATMVSAIQRVLHAILSGRIILHLRKQSAQQAGAGRDHLIQSEHQLGMMNRKVLERRRAAGNAEVVRFSTQQREEIYIHKNVEVVDDMLEMGEAQ